MSKLDAVSEMLKYYASFLNIDLLQLRYGGLSGNSNYQLDAIDSAIQWICRAQDAFPDGGVARSYSFIYNPYFGRKGWIPSYPETTGYIIPTFFDYAKISGNDDIHNRAIRMADWECDVQMDNGSVQGGTVEQRPAPAIFNTGQVIFGWCRAYEETKQEKYLKSAIKAGEFLLNVQDEDGAWRKALSDFTSDRMSTYAYNTRTAWALYLLGIQAGEHKFKSAAIKNIDYALTLQRENGWFESNCLNDPERPLLHTIAYCIRGILETGILSGNEEYIERACLSADALIDRLRENDSLAGRFDDKWQPAVQWSCLTGDAQTSIIWGRLFQITGKQKYLENMHKINNYLKSVQILRKNNPDIYGGITGSDPIHGTYGRYEILNWAVKFYIDALLLETEVIPLPDRM